MPGTPMPMCSAAIRWLEQKEYDQALADFDAAIGIDSKRAYAHYGRGEVWFYKKEYGKAIAEYDEAIRLDPKLTDPHCARAWILATCPDGRYRDGRKAVEWATKACELEQWTCPCELGTLAAAYAEVGDFESAVNWQSKANKLYSDAEDKKKGEARLKLVSREEAVSRHRSLIGRIAQREAGSLSEPELLDLRVRAPPASRYFRADLSASACLMHLPIGVGTTDLRDAILAKPIDPL